MRVLYNIGIKSYGFAIFIASFFNAKAGLWIAGRKNIFGILKETFKNNNTKVAWFHAASLGEFEQGRNVIETFKTRFPEYKILLTFFSPSGYEVRKDYKGADYVFYLPLDTPGNAKRFMDIVNPSIAIFVKYEFWFNYLNQLKSRNVPAYLISAKFRQEQYFFKSSGAWFRKQLHSYSQIFVQDIDSQTLLHSFGITTATVAGDTRFDRVISISKQDVSFPEIESFIGFNKLWLCGSTWKEDEDIILPVFDKLLQSGEKIKLLIAPHDINESRLTGLMEKCPGSVRYSEAKASSLSDKNIVIIDKIGILAFLYRYAALAYIGGGFGKGIHNITEAAVYGIPVVFGPNYYKFNEAHEIISRGGGFSVSDERGLNTIVVKLLRDEDLRLKTGSIAGEYIHEGAGATEKIIKVIIT